MALSPPRRVVVPLIVACGLMMENLDSAVLSTALPAVAESLGEPPLHLSLAITAYLFSLAVFIPVSGWLADRLGARNVFRAAIIVFITGSIAAGFSESLSQLVLARLFQGLGGSMMVPVGRLVVLRTVSKAEMVNAMAWLTTPALLGPVFGPPLGGFITTYLSWRWIFWLNVPIALVGIVLVSLYIENSKEPTVPPLDWRGFTLTGLGLAAAMFGLETIGRGIVPFELSVSLLALGAILLILYVLYTRRVEHPILALSLLRIPTFRASVRGAFVFRMAIGALPFLLPMMLQVGFGLSPFESGLLTFAGAAGALTMKLTAGPILRRFGFKPVLLGNALIVGISIAAIGLFRPDTPAWVILTVLLIGGFFRSLQFTAVNTLGYADIPQGRMSQATSFASMSQQLALTVGVALGAALLNATQVWHGGAPLGPNDFMLPFIAIGMVAASAAISFIWLPADAAAEVSGKRLGRRPAPPAKLSASPGE